MKQLKIKHPFWQAAGIGMLAGMRSAAAPAICSHILEHHRTQKLGRSPLKFMQKETVSKALKLLALSEFIIDKMPSTGNRIKPTGVAARCLSGMIAGASIFKASGGKALTGALLGGAAAVASTFGSFYLRKRMVKKTNLFDPIIGAIEDALVIGAGVGLVKLDE